jgi:hypothetical protein
MPASRRKKLKAQGGLADWRIIEPPKKSRHQAGFFLFPRQG